MQVLCGSIRWCSMIVMSCISWSNNDIAEESVRPVSPSESPLDGFGTGRCSSSFVSSGAETRNGMIKGKREERESSVKAVSQRRIQRGTQNCCSTSFKPRKCSWKSLGYRCACGMHRSFEASEDQPVQMKICLHQSFSRCLLHQPAQLAFPVRTSSACAN
jgi:hypothetical protein